MHVKGYYYALLEEESLQKAPRSSPPSWLFASAMGVRVIQQTPDLQAAHSTPRDMSWLEKAYVLQGRGIQNQYASGVGVKATQRMAVTRPSMLKEEFLHKDMTDSRRRLPKHSMILKLD
jgi:hypothetical protein